MVTPLQRQLVHIPFSGGIHQKEDQRWLEVGNQSNVTNGLWVKQNQIQKRPGLTTLSKVDINAIVVNNLTVGAKAYSYKNETGVIDGQYIRAYSPTLNRFSQKDEVSVCVATREGVSQTSTNVYDSDVTEVAGYRIRVWSDALAPTTSNCFYAVSDVANGIVVLAGVLDNVNSATGARMIGLGTRVIFIYQTGTNLLFKTLDLTTAGLVAGLSTTNVLTTLASGRFDAVPITSNSNLWAVVFEKAAGPNHLHLYTLNSTPTILSSIDIAGETGTGFSSFAMRGDTNQGLLWVVYANAAGGVKCTVYFPGTLAQLTAPFVIDAAGTAYIRTLGVEMLPTGNACIVNASNGLTAPLADAFKWSVWTSNGTNIITPNRAYNQWPLSKPFAVSSQDSVYGQRVYMMVANAPGTFNANVQTTQFLVELDCRNETGGGTWCHPVASVAPRFSFQPASAGGGQYIRSFNSLSNVTNVGNPSATKFVTTGTISESLSDLASGTPYVGRNGIIDVTFDFAHPGRYTVAELGDSLYISGGIPSTYDGNQAVEIGTLTAIDTGEASSTVTAGGSLQASQTYSYIFVEEWYDAKGQLVQGQPSLPYSITTTGTNKTANITIPPVNLTVKQDLYINIKVSNYGIICYRTAFVGGAMSTVFYRVGQVGSALPQNQTISFTDNGTLAFLDANIITNSTLYTTGGVLESDAPPSFTTLCTHKNRIFGIGDDQRTVYYSTEYVPGQAVRFNDALTLNIGGIGPIVACWSMDDKLFLASKSNIVWFSGSGPNELEQNSDLSGPFRVATDVGCTDPRSVVVTQAGTFFLSQIGITLLDRGLSVSSNIGNDIEDLIDAYPFVTSATQHPIRPEVWFTLATATGPTITTGVAVCYNYLFGTWSQHSYYDADQARAGAGFVSACSSGGTLYFLTPYGQMYSENTNLAAGSAYLDPGAQWITTSITTAWIKPAGLQGFGRMWRAWLGVEWNDGADLTLAASVDYGLTPVQTHTFPAAAITSEVGSIAQMEMRLVVQRGEAYRFTISDAAPTIGSPVTGRGVFFTGLTAEIGVKDRGYRMPAGKRA